VGTADGSGGIAFRGRVGSGLTGAGERRLRELLSALQRPGSPFSTEVPFVDGDGAVWTDPEVVVDVRSLGLSGGGRLRHPVLLAVRDDLTPADLPVEEGTGGDG
jgi:bifunctional non-homologous end joining protein LigD